MTEYLTWLKSAVHAEEYPKDVWVLDFLFQIPYHWSIELDENLAYWGLKLREIYAEWSTDVVVLGYLDGMCSVLEMLIALSNRLEQEIMHDPDLGDRAYIWFWTMVNKLRLDDAHDIQEAQRIVQNLLNRTYQPNGEGSVCGVLLRHPADLRTVDFWYQMSFWAEENFTFGGF